MSLLVIEDSFLDPSQDCHFGALKQADRELIR